MAQKKEAPWFQVDADLGAPAAANSSSATREAFFLLVRPISWRKKVVLVVGESGICFPTPLSTLLYTFTRLNHQLFPTNLPLFSF